MTEFLSTPVRQAAVVNETAHRPWPLPEAPWIQAQTWEDLCFLHWQVAQEELRAHVPESLEVETYNGAAWLGITPFHLTGFRVRGTPPVPFLSSFPELNVRTYVRHGDRPGIWFFSLDAGSPLAVEAARRLYRLPYFRARMRIERRVGWVHYDSSRDGAVFSGRYRGEGDFFRAEPGSLEAFLAERYCLYATDREGTLYTADIHHPPWSLQTAEAVLELNTMPPAGIHVDGDALAHFAARQDVVIWPLEPV
jgi:uncharacterized protein YqjF (DUF2071 family)